MIKICANCENNFEANRDRARFCSDICRASFHQVVKGTNGEIIVKIYALINPIGNSVFYIGKTIGTLESRLKAHLKNKENIERTKVIDKIINDGLTPNIIELERIPCLTEEEETNALLREDFWIKHYIEKGSKLCNVQGVKTSIKPRLLTSYQKESEKTRPTGIRFDIDKLTFIQKRENVPTKQKVVDFLLNKYWWENKVSHVTAKETPPLSLKNDKAFNEPIELHKSKVTLKRNPAHWVELRRECSDADEYAQWLENLENDPYLTTREKKDIKATV